MSVLTGAGSWMKTRVKDVFIRPSARYQALDGIRAISMIMIIVFHSWMGVSFLGRAEFERVNAAMPSWLLWITKTDLSVDAFFVMSGFLIGSILLGELNKRNAIDLKQFYIKRLFRLYPAYLFLIALVAIPVLLAQAPPKPPQNLWFNLFYISNFLPVKDMYIDWSWTLCVEEQFYILMPLILLACRRYLSSTLVVLVLLYILSYVIRFLIVMHYPQLASGEYTLKPFEAFKGYDMLYINALDNGLHTRYGAIITGVLGAYLYKNHRESVAALFQRSLLVNNLLLGAGLLMIGLLMFTPTYRPYFYQQDHFAFNVFYLTAARNIFSLGIMLLIFCSIYPLGLSRLVGNFLGWRGWFPVAQLSYSLYLFHIPFVALVARIALGKFFPAGSVTAYDILIISAVSFMLSCVFAFMVFSFVERPFMLLRDRFYQADKLAPEAAGNTPEAASDAESTGEAEKPGLVTVTN